VDKLPRNKLWVLNSGLGYLGTVDASGDFVPHTFCPGFLRGLRFIRKPRAYRPGFLLLRDELPGQAR
jgi:hypothetical protein